MSRNVWHKRYHGDALNGYMGLTLEERGAYSTLLDLMYDTDWQIGIRDNDRWIAGHMDCSVRKWCSLKDSLMAAGKIDVVDGYVSNPRYRKERENALETSRKRAESGASGGVKSGVARRQTAENSHSNEASASRLPLYARATDTETEADIEDTDVSSSAHTPPEKPVKPKRRGKAKSDGETMPEGWAPVLTDRAQQIVDGWPPGMLEHQTRKFMNHAADKGRQSKDWQAAFRTWIDNAEEWRSKDGTANRNGSAGAGRGQQAGRGGLTVAQQELARIRSEEAAGEDRRRDAGRDEGTGHLPLAGPGGVSGW